LPQRFAHRVEPFLSASDCMSNYRGEYVGSSEASRSAPCATPPECRQANARAGDSRRFGEATGLSTPGAAGPWPSVCLRPSGDSEREATGSDRDDNEKDDDEPQ
jgi:hypothetical protein